jgi:hypothetical protein
LERDEEKTRVEMGYNIGRQNNPFSGGEKDVAFVFATLSQGIHPREQYFPLLLNPTPPI